MVEQPNSGDVEPVASLPDEDLQATLVYDNVLAEVTLRPRSRESWWAAQSSTTNKFLKVSNGRSVQLAKSWNYLNSLSCFVVFSTIRHILMHGFRPPLSPLKRARFSKGKFLFSVMRLQPSDLQVTPPALAACDVNTFVRPQPGGKVIPDTTVFLSARSQNYRAFVGYLLRAFFFSFLLSIWIRSTHVPSFNGSRLLAMNLMMRRAFGWWSQRSMKTEGHSWP